MKLAGAMLLTATLLSGCIGDVYVTSTTVVTKRPSYIQEIFPRGEYVFACTTVGNLQYYLDNNIVLPGCGNVPMTAVTERGIYDSYLYGRVTIYEFMEGWKKYFTWNRSYNRYNYRYNY